MSDFRNYELPFGFGSLPDARRLANAALTTQSAKTATASRITNYELVLDIDTLSFQ